MPEGDPVPTFEYVEAAVRKKTFGVLTTIDREGGPHSTGVLYGVSPPASPFALFVLTLESYVKVRNVRSNPATTLVIPFPHRIFSFVPANCAAFRCQADIVPFTDIDGRWAFDQRRILRDNAAWLAHSKPVFLRLTPDPKILCYGLGIPLNRLRKEHTSGNYRIYIPSERLV